MHELDALQQKINALKMRRNRELKKQSFQENNLRKSRTRTLIQLGGLVQKAGLAEHFEVEMGDDLQGNTEGRDKAELILGFLIEALQNNSGKDIENYRNMGKAFLR